MRVLLIEDNETTAEVIREKLASAKGETYSLEHAGELSTGLSRITQGGFDLILLDLMLPDSHGLDTVKKTLALATQIPVVVLTGSDDDETALKAIQLGAQDYLVKGRFDTDLLARSLNSAVERKRVEEALRTSEERTRQIIDTAYDAFVAIDDRGLITDWNRQAETTFGWSREEIIGKPLVETIIPPQYREAHKRGLQRFLATTEGLVLNKRIEVPVLHRDGHEFSVELTIWPTRAGKSYRFNAFLHDITERKKIEQEKADFAAMLAHDLRSPLTTILSAAAIVEDGLTGPVNEAQKEWLAKISDSVQKLLELVNDFLDLSKLEAGRIDLMKEEVDLGQLIQGSLRIYRLLAGEKKLSLTSRINPSLPTLHADRRRLDQLFANLLSNAIKFTPKGGVIELGACREKGSGSQGSAVRVWVKDSGVGIPAAEIGQLFEKYRQTSSGKISGQKGTGLGLVICKMVVEAHGGRIWVESEEGKGSVFSFSLPLNI
jgi:PAS domain S-box-containing protein